MNLTEFLDKYGDALAERVMGEIAILHDPNRDALAHPEYDQVLGTLVRKPEPAQAEVIKAIAKALYLQDKRAIYLVGEMGVGKTLMALGIQAMARKPLRSLVMCPPHLVEKWIEEASRTLPKLRTVNLNGRNALRTLVRIAKDIRSGRIQSPALHEVWVIGRERAKRHFLWKAAYANRLRAHRITEETAERSEEKPGFITWREPACIACWRILTDPRDGTPIDPETLERRRTRCTACGAPAYTATNDRHRAFSPAQFISRYLKGFFDLFIADEVHELKGEDTGQGNAFHALSAACHKTIALTGTLMGGYADNIFALLFRTHTKEMLEAGFPWGGVERWMWKYGVLEKITRRSLTDDAKAVKGRRQARVTVRRKPGISPLVLGHHLLHNAVFLRLADVSDRLPPYVEEVVNLKMAPRQAKAYNALRDALLAAVREALQRGSKRLLSQYLQTLLCYPDSCFREEVVTDPETEKIIARAPALDGAFPKEDELLELIDRERREGRRVLVYVSFTDRRDITPRLRKLIEARGWKTAMPRPGVPPTEKRMQWIRDRVQRDNIDVLIANPELVKTGLDLIEFPTFIFYQTGYSIYTLRQAARRSWRIGQTEPVRVYYLVYQGTMQEQALKLIAKKLETSLAIEGELTEAGLTALSETGDTLFMEMARTLLGRVDSAEAAEAVWARLRRQELEQELALTAFTERPRVVEVTEEVKIIGKKTLIVDLIEKDRPRSKRLSRIEVTDDEIEKVLEERQARAQLALF